MSDTRIAVLGGSPELIERVRVAAATLPPGSVVVAGDGPGGVESVAKGREKTVPGAVDVVVAGPALIAGNSFGRLEALRRRAAALVLVVEQAPDAALRDVVRVGADDLLPASVGDDALAVALGRAVAIARRRTRRPAAPSPPPRGRVVTVGSPTEGCGKSFLAANTALFLARRTGGRVVLVDLDLQFGELGTALRIPADTSIADAVAHLPEEDDEDGGDIHDLLGQLLVHHPGGFAVLPAPRHPAEADRISPADVTRILRALRTGADHVVVDTSTGLGEHVLAALDVSDHLLAVTTPDRPSVHNLEVFLETLDRLPVPPGEVAVVLNKTGIDSDLGEAAARLPRSWRAVVPYDREVTRSINRGAPLLGGDARSPAARRLLALLGHLFPEAAPPPVAARRQHRSPLLAPVECEPPPAPPPIPTAGAVVDLTDTSPEPQPEPEAGDAASGRPVLRRAGTRHHARRDGARPPHRRRSRRPHCRPPASSPPTHSGRRARETEPGPRVRAPPSRSGSGVRGRATSPPGPMK